MTTCIDREVLCGDVYVVVQTDREKCSVILVPRDGNHRFLPEGGWENAKGAIEVPWFVPEATQ